MHGLTSRHRRKAGSGPPANALIAWIGADPHLRSVASHRRTTVASLPTNTPGTKAAVAAFVVLAGGAIMGITAIVNDGLVAPVASNPSPVLSQDAAATPGPAAPRGPVAGTGPNPMVSPAPIATESMTLNRQPQQPSPTLPEGSSSSGPVGYGGSSTTAPATQPVSPHRADPPPRSNRLTAPTTSHAGKPDSTVTLAGSANARNSADSIAPNKPASSEHPASAGSGSPAGSGNPAGNGSSTDPGNPAGSANLPSMMSPGDSGKPGGRGELIASGAGGQAAGGGVTPDETATPGVTQPSSHSGSSQNPTPTHGSVSTDGPASRQGSTPGQDSSPKEGPTSR